MNHFDRLRERIKILYLMVGFQKSLRLTVRALWMGAAGILLAWLAHAALGVLPNPLDWFLIGLGLASIPMAGIVFSLFHILAQHAPPPGWIRKVDDQLHMREQFTTAWELTERDEKSPVGGLLVNETLSGFSRISETMLNGGWYRTLDLTASGTVVVLVLLLFALQLLHPVSQPGSSPALLPQQAAPQPSREQNAAPTPGASGGAGSQAGESQNGQNDPSANGQQSGSSPSDNGANDASSNNAGSKNRQGSASGAGDQNGAVADALRQLGRELSKQAGTYDLGQSLQNLDMNSAAQDLQSLRGQLDELSPESRQNMSQSMGNAANDLGSKNAPDLSQDMQSAADALKSKDGNNAAGQALGQVAQDLQQLSSAMQQASGGDGSSYGKGQSSNTGQAQPLDRLGDENGQMELPQENPGNAGLLSPARPDAPGEGTASGSLDANRPQGSPMGQSPLIPNSLLWKWRDVVSQYFQH